MADDMVTDRGLRLPASALSWRADTSGGAGGQHANRTASRVEMTADLTHLTGPGADRVRSVLGDELVVTCGESRSQWRNRSLATKQLADRIDEAAVPRPKRRATRPTRSSMRARLGDKRRRSERKRARRWRPGPDDLV